MQTTITRRYRFAASHRLHVPFLPAAANADLYGKCNNPYGHGHDYLLEVTVAGPVDPVTGKLLAVPDLDRLVEAEILARFDRRNLNVDLPEFHSLVPTTENISLVIGTILTNAWQRYLPVQTSLVRIYIEETGRNSFEVLYPGGEPLRRTSVPAESEAAISHV